MLVPSQRHPPRFGSGLGPDGSTWIDHAKLVEADAERLAETRFLTVWAVSTPTGFYGALPRLERLDVRGGSGESADFLAGCDRLRSVEINQVRGVRDLSALTEASNVEFLSLYGLPQVTVLPSLRSFTNLRRVEIGSMNGLVGIGPVLDAPGLEELVLSRTVGLSADDPERIRTHASLRAFDWFAEDVPVYKWKPVVEYIAKPKARPILVAEWFGERD